MARRLAETGDGNTVVAKPAATTPLTTLKIGELCAGILPPGVINIIADQNDLGSALTGHPDGAKVTFTGSAATGKKVMESAAGSLKRLTLELGGNDAAIVLDDVDAKEVAPKLLAAAMFNSGQGCITIKRLYVHDSQYGEICDELARLARAIIVDDGIKQGTQMGPLQNKAQFEKVKGFLEDARQNGDIVAGGKALDRKGDFVQPTIVRDIADDARLVKEEQFGPILPVLRYSDVDARSRVQTIRISGSAAASGRKISIALLRSPHASIPARCGSTSISICIPRCLLAAPSNPVSGLNMARKDWKSSPLSKSSTSRCSERATRPGVAHPPAI